MSSAVLNPFRPTRWEQQQSGFQLIWFTRTADQIAAEKSMYVRGSRGSGKTTLLRSICWEDLSMNASLMLQRRISDFDHIGVYLRFPDHLSSSLSSSSFEHLPRDKALLHIEFHRYFSLLIEAACAERALTACHELRLSSHVAISPSQELQLVKDVLAEFPAITSFAELAPRTLSDLARLLRTLVRNLNQSAVRGTVQDLYKQLPAREPGELLAFITERLAACTRLVAPNGYKQPRFKFCLDDAEALNALQQKSINTLVRVCKFPISWVVSGVGSFFDSTETFIEQQPLTDADRGVVLLDRRKDDDFRELFQAVVSLRLMFSTSKPSNGPPPEEPIAEFFPLRGRLGRRSVNDMMSIIAQRSTNPIANRLQGAAKRLRLALRRSSKEVQGRYEKKRARLPLRTQLPLYESYVLLLWQGREEAFKTTFNAEDEKRLPTYAPQLGTPRFEAWLRRKQRAALLHFAARLGFRRLPLSGDSVVLSLADGSIRDFLEIMGEIFEAYARHHRLDASDPLTLERFATSRTQIASDIQTEGIYRSSEAYLIGMNARTERSADIVLRLLDGLGRYTASLQSDPDDPTVLGRAERGVFVVRFEGDSKRNVGDVADEYETAVWKYASGGGHGIVS